MKEKDEVGGQEHEVTLTTTEGLEAHMTSHVLKVCSFSCSSRVFQSCTLILRQALKINGPTQVGFLPRHCTSLVNRIFLAHRGMHVRERGIGYFSFPSPTQFTRMHAENTVLTLHYAGVTLPRQLSSLTQRKGKQNQPS